MKDVFYEEFKLKYTKRKVIGVIIAALLLTTMLAGCGRNDSLTSDTITERFFYIEDTNSGLSYNSIIVDRETGVMYLFHGSGYKGGLTIMVNPDGSPLVYESDIGSKY